MPITGRYSIQEMVDLLQAAEMFIKYTNKKGGPGNTIHDWIDLESVIASAAYDEMSRIVNNQPKPTVKGE
ncbi:MAG: hypothetical protein WC449_05360 [Candidatus Paceibacterota bacterium]